MEVRGVGPIDFRTVGWNLPTPDGKGASKGLDWGRQHGLDPNDPRWKAAIQGATEGAATGTILVLRAAQLAEIAAAAAAF